MPSFEFELQGLASPRPPSASDRLRLARRRHLAPKRGGTFPRLHNWHVYFVLRTCAPIGSPLLGPTHPKHPLKGIWETILLHLVTSYE